MRGVKAAVFLGSGAALAGALLIGGCDSPHAPNWMLRTLKPARESGELVILTLRGPTTTQDVPQAGKAREDSQTGFEHDLASLFAAEMGLKPKFRVMPSYTQLVEALKNNRGHLAAAGLSPSAELRGKFAFGPSYKSIQHQLIYRSADKKPRSMNEAAGHKTAVIAETPAHDILRELTGTYPGIDIDVLPHESDPDELLKRVEARQADFAIVDSNAFAVSKRLHPELASAFNVGREARVAWAFSDIADFELQQATVPFFDKIRHNGTLNRLIDRYYGHVTRMQPIDSEAFLEKRQAVLPKLRSHFHEAQELTGLDWRLLAAIGYQESHWDALATSPTGVRGLMMLTEETADRMKIKNRLDARESIIGGAKYFVLLRDTVPIRIPEPDRAWLALAAYNQGYGHLEDARILTQRMKLNADAWLDVRKAYLQMREPAVFETLKHGYCRGDEAVALVDAIRNYYDLLLKLEKPLEQDIRFDLMTEDADPGLIKKRAQSGSASVSRGK
jgi:membrane-bound lytic murein transglycosylase F